MATRKQRRRREKEKRHDYEFVYLDSEGNEVEVDEAEQAKPKAERNGSGRSGGAARQPSRRGQVQPPSWRRVARRGLIFGPIFLATVLLIGRNRITFTGAVVQALILIAVFVPFSYFLDSMLWRAHQRRQAKGAQTKR